MRRLLTLICLLLKRAFSTETRQDRFRRFALMNKWNNFETVSGPGSTVKYTENLRSQLPTIFEMYEIRSIFDAPCGDYNWMKLVEKGSIQYIGGDIVPELVNLNNQRYADDYTHFYVCDIVTDELPAVDIWICRDVLFHFSFNCIFQTLENLFRSDITYLLTTDHPDHEVNTDIRTGSFRTLNIMHEPFCFSEPLLWVDDWIKDQPVRRMGLWDVELLKNTLADNNAYIQVNSNLTNATPKKELAIEFDL